MLNALRQQRFNPTPFLLATYFIFCFTNVFYLFAVYMEKIGMPSGQTGFLVSAFYIATTLTRPLGGWLTEKIGTHKSLYLAILLAVGGSTLLAFSKNSFFLILLSRVLSGVGFGCSLVALTTLQSLVVPDEIRGSAFAWTTIGSIASMFTILPVCEFLVHSGHYSLYLWTAPCLALAAGLVVSTLPHAEKRGGAGTSSHESWNSLFGTPGLKTLLLSGLFFAAPDASIVYLANLTASRGLVASFFMLSVSLTALAVRVFGRRLPDVVPRPRLVAPSITFMAGALFGATLVNSNIQLTLCGIAFGIGMGLGYPVLFSLVGDLVSPGLQAKGTALTYLSQDICWMGIPLVMGFFKPLLGLSGTFRVMAIISIASAVVIQWMWTRKPGTSEANRTNQTIGG